MKKFIETLFSVLGNSGVITNKNNALIENNAVMTQLLGLLVGVVVSLWVALAAVALAVFIPVYIILRLIGM
jgi:hypothetical protein